MYGEVESVSLVQNCILVGVLITHAEQKYRALEPISMILCNVPAVFMWEFKNKKHGFSECPFYHRIMMC